MNQHRNNDVVGEDEIITNTEDGVPQYQQIQEIEFAAKQKSQPSTRKWAEMNNCSEQIQFSTNLHAKQG